jgi:hypothetical protein
MQRTFDEFPTDTDAAKAVTRLIDLLCTIEACAYPKAGGTSEGQSSKTTSERPQGDADALSVLADSVRMLNDTIDGKPNLTGIRKKLDGLIRRQTKKRQSRTCLDVQRCVTASSAPCGIPTKCTIAQESAIAQAMPKGAVARMRDKTPEERSADAKKAADARWAKYGQYHAN